MAECYFDTRVGELLVGVAAIEQRMQESSPGDIVPLAQLLTAEPFPFSRRDFAKPPNSSWSPEDIRATGSVVIKLVESLERKYMDRMYILGLGPEMSKQRHFASMVELRKTLGVAQEMPNHHYEEWSRKEFIEYAFKLSLRLGRKPTVSDYRASRGPGPDTIHKRIGGIGELNELIGYPNSRAWDLEDFVDWGVKVMRVNSHDDITVAQVKQLAKQGRGPSDWPIVSRFGSWNEYKRRVLQEHYRRKAEAVDIRRAKLRHYQSLIDGGQLPSRLRILPEDDLLHYGAKYTLARHLLLRHDEAVIAEVASVPANLLLRKLKIYRSDLRAPEMETQAVILGVFDDIWPMDEFDEALKVA